MSGGGGLIAARAHPRMGQRPIATACASRHSCGDGSVSHAGEEPE
jgi:hypothetical protein